LRPVTLRYRSLPRSTLKLRGVSAASKVLLQENMWTLARKLLLHDRLRFAVAIAVCRSR